MVQPQPSPAPLRPAPPTPSAPPRDAVRPPSRVEQVPGSPYGLAIYSAPPAVSGQAIGGLVAGVASVLVALVVSCFGFAALASAASGQPAAWGALVGGAFTVLAVLLGLAGLGLGLAGLRQIRAATAGSGPAGGGTAGGGPVGGGGPGTGARAPVEPIGGRAMAVAGIACGGAGVVIALCSLGVAGLSSIS